MTRFTGKAGDVLDGSLFLGGVSFFFFFLGGGGLFLSFLLVVLARETLNPEPLNL